ncbi:MAG: restriction endonuclease subunit S [Pyrinomonadaceae bacterium]
MRANLLARSTPIAFIAEGKYWVNNHAHVVTYCEKAELEFLEVLFLLIDISSFITGSAQPKLNRSNLDKTSITNPPSEKQKQFVNFYKERPGTKSHLEKSKQSIENLLQSLQKKAFRGELFNGNSKDELTGEKTLWQQTSFF